MADAPEPLLEVRDQVVLKDAGRGVVSRVAPAWTTTAGASSMNAWTTGSHPTRSSRGRLRSARSAGRRGATARAHTSAAWCRISKTSSSRWSERRPSSAAGGSVSSLSCLSGTPAWSISYSELRLGSCTRATARRGFSAARSRGAFQRRGSRIEEGSHHRFLDLDAHRPDPGAWEKYGRHQHSSSGIVDGNKLQSAFRSSLDRLQGRERDDGSNVLEFSMLAHKLWSVLNLEAWARQWS